MESPSQVLLESYLNWIGQFPCTTSSSTPIRVVTREVRYIPCDIHYSRIFYAYEQSRCPGSDKPQSSSLLNPASVEYF